MQFVPTSIDRPATIADLFAERFFLARHAARAFVANLHGFDSWSELAKAVAVGPASPLDSDVEPDIAELRRSVYAALIGHKLSLNPHVSMRVADEISVSGTKTPTISEIPSDAGRFEFLGRTDRFSAREARQTRRQTERRSGIGAGLLAANLQVAPYPWIDCLTKTFGFEIQDARPFVTNPLSRFGELRVKNARCQLFLAGHAHLPESENAATDLAEREIARDCAHAALFFQHPVAWTDDQRIHPTRPTALYGGRVLKGGRWTDFILGQNGPQVLRRPDGIRAADLSADYVTRHLHPAAAQAAINIATTNANVRGLRPFVLPAGASWAIILCLDQSAIRALNLSEAEAT